MGVEGALVFHKHIFFQLPSKDIVLLDLQIDFYAPVSKDRIQKS